jgi:hypothetical protein
LVPIGLTIFMPEKLVDSDLEYRILQCYLFIINQGRPIAVGILTYLFKSIMSKSSILLPNPSRPMTKYCQFLISLLFLFNAYDKNLFGQTKSDLASEAIIDKFIEKIGGEKWLSLKSRKEYAYVEYEEDKNSIIPTKSDDRIKIDLQPGQSIEVHNFSGNLRSILVLKLECNWHYSNRSQMVKFFGPERVKYKNTFPRTELMEILNLEPMKKVSVEDTLYRVDFKDIRQLDGKQSLFFGVTSGLLYKRSMMSKNEVLWEFHFSNYMEAQGFSEPRQVTLTANGKDYFTIAVKYILYNVEIDTNVFNPPIACKNEDTFKHLEFPYMLDLN